MCAVGSLGPPSLQGWLQLRQAICISSPGQKGVGPVSPKVATETQWNRAVNPST